MWLAELIVLKDFNMHHHQWGGDRVRRNFNIAWELIAQIDALSLQLAILDGEIIWQKRESTDTILNLIFLSSELYEQLLTCKVDAESDMALDHFSVTTVILSRT